MSLFVIFVSHVAGNKGPTVNYEVSFAMLGSSIASDLEVVVAASYTNESGELNKVNFLYLLTHFSPISHFYTP